jgi:hypothetical protein
MGNCTPYGGCGYLITAWEFLESVGSLRESGARGWPG